MWGRGMRSFGVCWPWVGVFDGIAILAGSVRLYVKPEHCRSWGVLTLVASALNFFLGMMGPLARTVGVISRVLAMITRD